MSSSLSPPLLRAYTWYRCMCYILDLAAQASNWNLCITKGICIEGKNETLREVEYTTINPMSDRVNSFLWHLQNS